MGAIGAAQRLALILPPFLPPPPIRFQARARERRENAEDSRRMHAQLLEVRGGLQGGGGGTHARTRRCWRCA